MSDRLNHHWQGWWKLDQRNNSKQEALHDVCKQRIHRKITALLHIKNWKWNNLHKRWLQHSIHIHQKIKKKPNDKRLLFFTYIEGIFPKKELFILCPPWLWTYTCKMIFFLLFVHLLSTTDQMKLNDAQFLLVKENVSDHHKSAL